MAGERVLLAQLSQESNTFSTTRTNRMDFQNRWERYGDDVIAELRNTNTVVAGGVDVAERENLTLSPSVAAEAEPGGRVTADAYEHYVDRIVDDARTTGDKFDGVLLALHGAMVPEGRDDGEGPLIAAVRDVVGADVPIIVTLDLHGNITDAMLEADALVAFETYPHVDMRETGRRAMDLLLSAARGETSPTMDIERPPVIAPGPNANTDDSPMADLEARARDLETRDGVLRVNVMPGFYRADIPVAGFSVPVVTDDDPTLAREVAREMAELVWELREGFAVDHPEPAEAVAEAKRLVANGATADGPVVVADVGDNPGGGSPGDETSVLREFLDQDVPNAGFVFVRDPESVATCVDAGVGETVSVELGGKSPDSQTEPVAVSAYVKSITDGTFTNTGPMQHGATVRLGRTVLLECGTDRGARVVVAENRKQPWDAELWRHVGVEPESLDVIGVKSANHYRGDYGPMASHVLPVDSIGLNNIDPSKYDYDRINRPKFLLDAMDDDDYPNW